MIWRSGWFWVLLAPFLIWASRLPVIRAWWHGRRREPEPPENIRAVYPDGRIVPLECVYRGFHNDLHHWLVVVPESLQFELGMEITWDRLVPRTNLEVPFHGDGAGAGWS